MKNPTKSISRSNIYVTDKNKILWQWTFDKIGSGKYPVTGFNLFYISNKKEIFAVDIEFNSIAWGVDTTQIGQYCSK